MSDYNMIRLPNGGFALGSRLDEGTLAILLNKDANLLKCSQHGDSINALVRLEDGNILAASKKPNGKFRIYNSVTGKLMKSFSQEDHTTTVLLLLPHGKVAAFSPLWHYTVRLFDPYRKPHVAFETFQSWGVGNAELLLHYDTEVREMLRTGELSLKTFLNTDMASLIPILAKYKEDHQTEEAKKSENKEGEEEYEADDEASSIISLSQALESFSVIDSEESQTDLSTISDSTHQLSREEILFFNFEEDANQQDEKNETEDEENNVITLDEIVTSLNLKDSEKNQINDEENKVITLDEMLASFKLGDTENNEKSQTDSLVVSRQTSLPSFLENAKESDSLTEDRDLPKSVIAQGHSSFIAVAKNSLFQQNEKDEDSVVSYDSPNFKY